MLQNILVMGAGAVGGYFGGRIAEKTKTEVYLVARGNHLEKIKKDGLKILSPDSDAVLKLPATSDPAGFPEPDLILFTVKSFDTDRAIRQIKPVAGKETIILTLQNGIENYRKLKSAFGDNALQGLCQIGAGLEKPGVIRHDSFGLVVFGEQNGRKSKRTGKLAELFDQAGISNRVSDHIRKEVWLKFAWNTVYNSMTAALNVPVNLLYSGNHSEEELKKLLMEVKRTAKAEGVEIEDKELDDIFNKSRGLEGFITSTLRDRRAGKPLEYDGLTGALLRTASKHGIELPRFSLLHGMLQAAGQSSRSSEIRDKN